MYKKNVIVFCVFVLGVVGQEPQVYENVDDQVQVESNARVVREPFAQPKPKLHKPQVFSPQVAQQDRRRFRYIQQQLSDMQNILRKKHTNSPLAVAPVRNWRAVEPSFEENYQLPETTVRTISTTKKTVTSRKMGPNSYYEDLDGHIKRQDNNIDKNIKIRRADYDFNALNALVGRSPNQQLEGLKRLLEPPPTEFVLPLIKTPLARSKPITELVHDIPNPNTHPNIDTSVPVENQLDESTRIQLAQTLEDAHKQARALVDAQHQAIAKAREEAQKQALAQIALHNQAIQQESLSQPLALALKQEAVPSHLYAPTHGHAGQIEASVKTPTKANLKTISFVKTHSVNHSPQAYQEVTLQSQQKRNMLYPGLNQLQAADDLDKNHQYAARYAFGYKIRDVKMGNEYGHEEKRDGESAKGFYHVLLPDGRMQKVEYYADPSGYHAKVTYEDLARQ